MAIITNSINEATHNQREYRSRIDKVHQFAKSARLPKVLLYKLLLFYEIGA